MITFNITNIVSEGNKIIVFYRFSNGQEFSNRFDSTASVIELMNWGNEQIQNFEKAKIELEQKIIELQEQIQESI